MLPDESVHRLTAGIGIVFREAGDAISYLRLETTGTCFVVVDAISMNV